MNTLRYFPVLLLAISSGLPLSTPLLIAQDAAETQEVQLSKEEAAAVKAFEKEMLAVQAWLIKARDAAAEQDAAHCRLPAQLAAKLAAVPVKGLPAPLSKALRDLRTAAGHQAALYKDLPAENAAAATWMEEKLKDAKFSSQADVCRQEMDDAEMALAEQGRLAGAGGASDLSPTSIAAQTKDRWVVILGAYKDFAEAKIDGGKAAKATNLPFSLRGMVFDRKGLHLPDDLDDEVYAGQYIQRINNSCSDNDKESENHISVEKSEGYDGFAPGFYITVGWIAGTAAEAEEKAVEFRRVAPGTYIKKTKIFYGCDR